MEGKQKKGLNTEEKQILSDLNDILFPNFKQHQLNFYQALTRCGLKMDDQQTYYKCTDSIREKEKQAENKMKDEFTLYEVKYFRFSVNTRLSSRGAGRKILLARIRF